MSCDRTHKLLLLFLKGCILNTIFQYAKQIQDYYARDDFVGSVAYQYFSPPRATPPRHTKMVTSPVSQAKREAMVQPKLRLRWLANYQNIGSVIALYVFMYMWFGTGIVGSLLLMMFGAVLYCMFKAFMNPKPKVKLR